ncbi:MAG: acyl-CoA dehydrogenase family protein, partial [Chloroflexota bacterium]
MDFQLSDEQRMIRDLARDFAQREIAPQAQYFDKHEEFPYKIVAQMAELGFMGLPIPEDYGGAGSDTLTYALAVEEISRGDASVGITMAAHT